MATFNLRIVIDALNKASGEIAKVKTEIQGVDNASKNAKPATDGFSGSISGLIGKAGLVAGAIAAVTVAFNQFYEAAKEGADIEYVRMKFDDLATSIGTTSDALLTDLMVATRNTRSEFELMNSASQLMALGLADDHDEVVRLTRVAGALNMPMNQLVLALTNMTTMRFDSLGVSVAGFDEKLKALEATGLSANEAFTEAFLQQAEEQIERVGDATLTSVGKIQRMEAALKDLGDAFKVWLAPGVANTADSLALLISGGASVEDVMKQLNRQVMAGEISFEDYKSAVAELGKQYGVNVDETVEYAKHTQITTTQIAGQKIESNLLTEALVEQALANDELNFRLEHTSMALEGQTDAMNAANTTTVSLEQAMTKYSDALLFKTASEGLSADASYKLAEQLGLVDQNTVAALTSQAELKRQYDAHIITQEEYIEKTVELAEKTNAAAEASKNAAKETENLKYATLDASLAMSNYTKELLFKIASEGLSAESALDLAEKMGLVDQTTVTAWEAQQGWRKLLDDTVITQDEYNIRIADMAEKLDNLKAQLEAETITQEEYNLALEQMALDMAALQDKTVTVTLNGANESILTLAEIKAQIQALKNRNIIINTEHHDYYYTHGSNLQAQAIGGPVIGGSPYAWQEYGYGGELFVPSQNGYILSRAEASDIISKALRGNSEKQGGDINITVYGATDPDQVANQIKMNLQAARAIIGVN